MRGQGSRLPFVVWSALCGDRRVTILARLQYVQTTYLNFGHDGTRSQIFETYRKHYVILHLNNGYEKEQQRRLAPSASRLGMQISLREQHVKCR